MYIFTEAEVTEICSELERVSSRESMLLISYVYVCEAERVCVRACVNSWQACRLRSVNRNEGILVEVTRWVGGGSWGYGGAE